MFHLPRGDQTAAFASVSRVLRHGASDELQNYRCVGRIVGLTKQAPPVVLRCVAVPSFSCQAGNVNV